MATDPILRPQVLGNIGRTLPRIKARLRCIATSRKGLRLIKAGVAGPALACETHANVPAIYPPPALRMHV